MKQWYSDCVRHILRDYIDTIETGATPKFRTTAERVNWTACHDVMTTLNHENVKLVCEIYRRGDTIADNIYRIATDGRVSQGRFWNLVDDIEYKLAEKRGLI